MRKPIDTAELSIGSGSSPDASPVVAFVVPRRLHAVQAGWPANFCHYLGLNPFGVV